MDGILISMNEQTFKKVLAETVNKALIPIKQKLSEQEDVLLSAKEAAGILGVTTQTLMTRVKHGEIKCVREGNAHPKFKRSEIIK